MEWCVFGNLRPENQARVRLSEEAMRRVKQVWREMLVKEVADRRKIEREAGRIEMLADRDSVDYDAHPCDLCVGLCYLSWVHCSACSKDYCIKHGLFCQCPPEAKSVVYRYSTEELESV